MKINKILKPNTLEEAYNLLIGHPKASVIGGGLFMRLQKKTYPLIVDLDALNLNYIKPLAKGYEIGAMTSLRTLEKSNLPDGIIDATRQIAGVGVRNIATLGGSICGRYPFSDINIALQAMNATLNFYHHGSISIDEFLNNGIKEKDILMSIVIPQVKISGTKYFKKVYTDFSIVNVAYADGQLVVGARPGRGVLIKDIDKNCLDKISFGDDFKASGEYRRALAESLIEDLLKDLEVPYGS